MKLIIDIPEKIVTAIQNGEDYRYDIHTAIAQGIPYEERPQGGIDNAPSVCGNNPKWCESCVSKGKCASTRPQDEITNDDIQQAIKEGFANGYEMAKEKIIHSIAKQYSEHNKLVPIWLSIGDIKDGAE